MADQNAANWNAIFYGEGRMDVQRTNELYRRRYGDAGTTPGYTNTIYNPAQTANPANVPGRTTTPTAPPPPAAPPPTQQPTQQPTNPNQQPPGQAPPTNQPTAPGGIPPNAQTSTADLLKEFLESDPDLMLNMVGNKFRDMGASNVFMQWFTNNFRSFWGRYLGYVAEQAYNGQIPNLSFVDWVMQFDTQGAFYQGGAGRQVQSGAGSATWANFVAGQGQT